MILFVHIPKTGGTSVRNAAEAHFGPSAMLYDYGPDAARTSDVVNAFRYERDDPSGLARWAVDNDVAMLVGHFKLDTYRAAIPDASTLTWVRDPVERVRSLHRHRRRHHGEVAGLDEFSARTPYRNGIVDQAGPDVDAFDVVGVLERHDASTALLNQTFGTDLAVRHDNVGAGANDHDRDDIHHGDDIDIDQALRTRIRNRNRRDVDFVTAAIARLDT